MNSKLILGTVQFGVNYGINNNAGQVTQTEVNRILEYAAENGIEKLDTSSAYGNSEEALGNSNLINCKKLQLYLNILVVQSLQGNVLMTLLKNLE